MSENNQTNSNGRGGARKGAGRKPGAATKKTREVADKAASEGITPLEYLLDVMRNSGDGKARMAAAMAAAPYIHPKLASVEHTGKDGGPMESVTRVMLVDMDDDSED